MRDPESQHGIPLDPERRHAFAKNHDPQRKDAETGAYRLEIDAGDRMRGERARNATPALLADGAFSEVFIDGAKARSAKRVRNSSAAPRFSACVLRLRLGGNARPIGSDP